MVRAKIFSSSPSKAGHRTAPSRHKHTDARKSGLSPEERQPDSPEEKGNVSVKGSREPDIPTTFIQRTSALIGKEDTEELCRALEGDPPVSIRRNPLKAEKKEEKEPEFFRGTEPVPWCKEGRYLLERPSFTLDPLFHAGGYYVQEASSMFIEQAFRQIGEKPQRVLDLCAAPGGKSTLWRSILPDDCLLVANEVMPQRAMILLENILKWGHPGCVVTRSYAEDFATLPSFFDIIATDVPCSGEGMFRKDKGAREEWSDESPLSCAERQRNIVENVWPALRTGGYLIYSTCTFNREENEDNVQWICHTLGAEPVAIPLEKEWGISGDVTGRDLPVYRFFPHKSRGEGFFLALLRKTSEERTLPRLRRNPKETAVKGSKTVAGWLKDAPAFKIFRPDENHISALPKALSEDVIRLTGAVKILSAGIPLAEEKGHKLIPAHALSLSIQRNESAFPLVELNKEEALSYLRRESLVLKADAPRGYVVATYQGHALGFLNNLGNRANNLYPAEWRIRMNLSH